MPDNKRRSKVAQILEGFGYRVQKSVFECEVNVEQFKKMKQRVLKEIDKEGDSVRYYILCSNCLNKIQICGLGKVARNEPFFVV